MSKTALVVSGGGSKGAFAVGAIQHLIKNLNLRFDIVAGTSTGALIAPLAVVRDINRLLSIYTSVQTGDILYRRPLNKIIQSSSVFVVDPLAKLIGGHMSRDRVRAVLQSQTQMFIAAVCLQDGKTTFFHTKPGAVGIPGTRLVRIRDRDTLCLSVLASSDQPVLMPPVPIPRRSRPVRQYVDGGVKEYAPLQIAIENGATDIYAILLSPKTSPAKNTRYDNVLDIAGRTIGLLVDDVGQNDLGIAELYADATAYLDAVKRKIQNSQGLSRQQVNRLFDVSGVTNPFRGKSRVSLKIIRPASELPSAGLEFDPNVMKDMLRKGRNRAKAVLGG